MESRKYSEKDFSLNKSFLVFLKGKSRDFWLTGTAPVTQVVKQGCPWAPLFFSLFLNDIVSKLYVSDFLWLAFWPLWPVCGVTLLAIQNNTLRLASCQNGDMSGRPHCSSLGVGLMKMDSIKTTLFHVAGLDLPDWLTLSILQRQSLCRLFSY